MPTGVTACLLAISLAFAAVAPGAGQETIDEVLAIVGTTPILRSDMELASLVGVFDRVDGGDDSPQRAALDARIDLELQYLDLVDSGALRRLEYDPAPTLEAMTAKAGGEEALRHALAERGLEWEDVEALAVRVAATRAWVERTLRPRVNVTVDDIEKAYRTEIVAPMTASGDTPPSLAAVSDRLRRLVAEQKLNEEIARWTDQARDRHDVTIYSVPAR